jgi:hypothetical protein
VLLVILIIALAVATRRVLFPADSAQEASATTPAEQGTAGEAATPVGSAEQQAAGGAARAQVAAASGGVQTAGIQAAAIQARAALSEGSMEILQQKVIGVEGLSLELSRPLVLDAERVQGLAVDSRFFYVSTFHPQRKTALVYQMHRDSYTVAQTKQVGGEGHYQAGGMDRGAEVVWVPVARTAEGHSTSVLGLDPVFLDVKHRFRVDDYVVALAETPSGTVLGVNDSSSVVYEWNAAGEEIRQMPLAGQIRYSEMTFIGGRLVCAGQDQHHGVIDVLDPESLTLLARHRAYSQTASGRHVTAAGFDYDDGTFFFVPDAGHWPHVLSYTLKDLRLEQYVPRVE